MTTAVGFPLRTLPPWLRVTNTLARRGGVGLALLEPARLQADAARRAGLQAELPAWVVEGLEVLWRSLNEDTALTPFGVLNLRMLLLTGLSSLLAVERRFALEPGLADTPLNAPLLVTGLPRSGTTHLHRLLSSLEDAEPVRLYQHVYPVRPRGPDTRRVRSELEFFPWRMASKVYNVDAMHHVRPGLPDECNFGMRLGGRSMIYWATAPTHGYLRWLLAQDLRETYQLYRKVLILHQQAAPGRRLTLKCPHHLASLPALAEALPEALVVVTHRDPVAAVPSECKLILSLHGLGVQELDWRRSVESNAYKVRVFSQRLVEFSEGPQAHRLVHAPYQQLVGDPVGLVRALHAQLGLPFEEAQAARVQAFVQENRQHKHGKNPYTAAQFGLDTAQIAEDFSAYTERFRPYLEQG